VIGSRRPPAATAAEFLRFNPPLSN